MKKLTYLFLIAISLFCTVNCTVPGDIADGVQSKAQSQIQVQYPTFSGGPETPSDRTTCRETTDCYATPHLGHA